MTTTNELPTYDAITDALQECQAPVDAAELHGLIAGILSVTHDVNASIRSLHNLVPEPDSEDSTIQNGVETLENLCRLTALQLEDHSFDFHLLVPSDDASLATRTETVGFWCQGFVSGLGEGGLSLPTQSVSEYSSELTEIIHDLIAISQIDTSQVEDSEEEEVAYHELVEYVRVVVMTVYTDIANDRRASAKSTMPSKTIH